MLFWYQSHGKQPSPVRMGCVCVLIAWFFFGLHSAAAQVASIVKQPIKQICQIHRPSTQLKHSLLAEDPKEVFLLKAQAERLLPAFCEQSIPIDELFDAAFVQQVGKKEIEQLLRQVGKMNGHATGMRFRKHTGPFQAEMEVRFPKNVRVPMTISIDRTPPHRILGLLVKPSFIESVHVDSLLVELKQLPGTTSVLVRRINNPGTTIMALGQDTSMAVGSSFKLVVLAALIDAIEARRVRWTDVVYTKAEWRSLPIGLLQDWPAASPVTVHTLAVLMMSQSDNTATDHLIHLLGRDRIEAMQTRLGFRQPERNQPLLTTADVFRLKLMSTETQRSEYLRLDPSKRRQWLEQVAPMISLKNPQPLRSPLAIDQLGWFASTADLCRALEWMIQKSEALNLLKLSQPFSLSSTRWPYVGFKGGAEAGVLNHTLLLQNYKKVWYAISVTQNNPDEDFSPVPLLEWLHALVDHLDEIQP